MMFPPELKEMLKQKMKMKKEMGYGMQGKEEGYEEGEEEKKYVTDSLSRGELADPQGEEPTKSPCDAIQKEYAKDMYYNGMPDWMRYMKQKKMGGYDSGMDEETGITIAIILGGG